MVLNLALLLITKAGGLGQVHSQLELHKIRCDYYSIYLASCDGDLFYNFIQIDFILAVDGFTHQLKDFLPSIIRRWLTAKREITVLVYNKLSAWQKLQVSALERDHDLRISAREFTSLTEVCTLHIISLIICMMGINLRYNMHLSATHALDKCYYKSYGEQ